MLDTSRMLNKLLSGQDLSTDDMHGFMTALMSGTVSPVIAGAILVALRAKVETIDELVTAAQVMREFSNKVHMNDNSHLVDIVGTGGDGTSTFNISTTCLFVVAGAGGKVAKHGNRSVSSKSGSADAIETLGAHLILTPEQVAECIEKTGMGFMFAPNHHPAMRHISPIRRELGIRTMFNMIGPLANPASAPHILMGVYDPSLLPIMSQAMDKLGATKVLVVHSEDGLDEVSISAPTRISELNQGQIKEYTITPEDFGLQRASLEQLRVNDPQESIAMLKSALENHAGAARDIVLLNSGVTLYTANLVPSIADGIELARATIASGAARAKVDEYAQFTQTFKV